MVAIVKDGAVIEASNGFNELLLCCIFSLQLPSLQLQCVYQVDSLAFKNVERELFQCITQKNLVGNFTCGLMKHKKPNKHELWYLYVTVIHSAVQASAYS